MNVAIYIRVSLDESSDSKRFQDVTNQLSPLQDYCKAFNHTVVQVYEDRMSGANPNRPAFRQMMNDAKQGRFEAVVVWKLDRFSRENISNTLAYIKQLKDSNVRLISMTETWCGGDDSSITELMLSIFAWVAALEREKISQRTKIGIARKRELGTWRGGRPRKVGVVI